MGEMKIEAQLAVFLDNRPGTLSRTCRALAAADINILALSVVDAVDHAIVRMVVDRPKEAEHVLSQLHALVQRRDVLVLRVPNKTGTLAEIAERLAQAGINLEYAYCTALPGQPDGGLVLRTNDLEATINALN